MNCISPSSFLAFRFRRLTYQCLCAPMSNITGMYVVSLDFPCTRRTEGTMQGQTPVFRGCSGVYIAISCNSRKYTIGEKMLYLTLI